MQKVIRDGKVAVLYSPGYGAGEDELVRIAKRLFKNSYYGGACQLEIVWVTEGAPFRITEYDGYESIERAENTEYITA